MSFLSDQQSANFNFYSLLEYKPAFNNLYTIEIFDEDDVFEKIDNYIKFQATSISFGSDRLELKRHPVTKKFYIDGNGFNWTDKLTITWRENEFWKIKKYHEAWLGKFYNKDTDSFISYSNKSAAKKALCRNFKITLPRYYDGFENYSTVLFTGVMPANTGELSLRWSQQPDIIQHTIEYYVEDWHWESSGQGTNVKIGSELGSKNAYENFS